MLLLTIFPARAFFLFRIAQRKARPPPPASCRQVFSSALASPPRLPQPEPESEPVRFLLLLSDLGEWESEAPPPDSALVRKQCWGPPAAPSPRPSRRPSISSSRTGLRPPCSLGLAQCHLRKEAGCVTCRHHSPSLEHRRWSWTEGVSKEKKI